MLSLRYIETEFDFMHTILSVFDFTNVYKMVTNFITAYLISVKL